MTDAQPAPFSDLRPSKGKVFGGVSGFLGAMRDRVCGWVKLPANGWARLLALLAILSFIKAVLLVRMGKQLFETHWRVGDVETNWTDYFAFGLFVSLGVLSLVRLGVRCRASGVKAVRAANAVVIVLALVFIFLTSHSGKNNYLYPIFSGLLEWSSLKPYLSLDWFFHAPFLAAWVFVYAFVYYLLVRTKRESWALFVTAGFAGVYGFCYLGEFIGSREQLWVADCLGLVCVASMFRSSKPMSFAWALLPLCWGLAFSLELLRFAPVEMHVAAMYFWGLLAGTILLFSVGTMVAGRSGFSAGWNQVLAFFFTAFLLLVNSHFPVSPNYSHLLCLGFEVPHYFFGEVLAVLAVGLCLLAWHRFFPKKSFWCFDLIALALIAIGLVDLGLSHVMGVRLEWNVLALGNSPKMIWRMAAPFLPWIMGVLAVLGIMYWAILRGFARAIRPATACDERQGGFGGIGYALACFALLAVLALAEDNPDKAEGQAAVRLAQTSPIWKRWTSQTFGREEFLRRAQALGLGNFEINARARSAEPRKDLNVVLVLMESSFNKHLSLFGGEEETQPLLSKYKNRMELFPNFFSAFASSIHARFAVFTSLYPIQDYNAFTLDRVPVKSLFEILHENDYTCSLFYSSFADFTGFRDFLKQRGIDELYDADTMPGKRTTPRVAWGLREEETLGAIKAQIRKYAAGEKNFFLTYVPAAPHHPFEDVPERFQKFKAAEPGDHTPAYLNQLLYMDWVIASIVNELKQSGQLDKTLVIITDDHGELLGAKGGPIGHGWLLTPELANAPLIIMNPSRRGYRVNETIGSQVDLLPTLLELLNISLPADQLYQGASLYRAQKGGARRIYSNSYQQYAIIEDNRILLGDRDREKGSGGSRALAYTIWNDGSKTLFNACDSVRSGTIAIREFDKFQESLLRNYSFYCSSIPKTEIVVKRESLQRQPGAFGRGVAHQTGPLP